MVLVRTLLAPPQIHGDPELLIEAHYGHGALVHHPEVVVLVETHGMAVSKTINAFADFPDELTGGIELQQLGGSVAVERAGGGSTRMIQHHDGAFGIHGNAENF